MSKTVVVTVGAFVASIFAYFLQIFLGRWLSIEDFGTFTALLSLSVILGVFLSASITSLVKLVSSLTAKEKFDTLTQLFIQFTFIALGVGLIFFVAIYLAGGYLAQFLSIADVGLFTYFGFFIGLSFLTLLPTAYLQGLMRFRSYSAFMILRQFLRLFFSVLAVLLGFGLVGVFVGMSVGIIVSYVVGVMVLMRNFKTFSSTSLGPYYKKVLKFGSAVLFVQIGMTLLNNIDVVLVKHFFDGVTAGFYAGLVTVGKVLLFGASTVGIVMFPMISAAYEKGEDYLERFKSLLQLQIFVVILGVIVFGVFPKLITRIMFGSSYLPSAEYLPRFALFVGFYVLINFMMLFLLAIEKVKVFLFLFPAVVAQILLVFFFHNSIVNIINVNLIISFILLVGIAYYFVRNTNFFVGSNT